MCSSFRELSKERVVDATEEHPCKLNKQLRGDPLGTGLDLLTVFLSIPLHHLRNKALKQKGLHTHTQVSPLAMITIKSIVPTYKNGVTM